MKLSGVVLSACAALGLACGAVADDAPKKETARLEYKLKTGMELTYKSAGTFKTAGSPQGAVEGIISGTARFVFAEADGGMLLIGQLPAIKVVMKTPAPEGGQSRDQKFEQASVCRMDRAGNAAVRTMKNSDALPRFMPMMLRRLDQRQLDSAPLPPAQVAVGGAWQGATEVCLHGFPLSVPAQIASTLAEIKTVEKHRCALIKSKLSPSDKKIAGLPDLALSGDLETLFDLDGGYSRSTTGHLSLTISENGEPVSVTVEMASTLESVKTLPGPEAAREIRVIRTFDAAIASLYDGEYDKAAAALGGLKPGETPAAWKAGIQNALASVKRFQRMAERLKGMPPAE